MRQSKREYNARYWRERYDGNVAHSICTNCGQADAEQDRRKCAGCLAVAKADWRCRKKAKERSGICARCPRKLRSKIGHRECFPCRTRRRARYNAAKRALCTACVGLPLGERCARCAALGAIGHHSRRYAVVESIKHAPDCSVYEIAADIGISTRSVLRHLKALLALGVIRRREDEQECYFVARYSVAGPVTR